MKPSAPIRVDAFTELRDGTDFDTFVRDRLAGGGVAIAGDQRPFDLIERAYEAARGSAYQDRISESVAKCLSDYDPGVRAYAILFFQTYPNAKGGERVVELAKGDRRLFAGIANRWISGGDLEEELLRAVAARLPGDTAALALSISEALKPGRAGSVIAGLTQADPNWVEKHAEEIARKSPRAVPSLIFNLQGSSVDVGAVGARIAPIVAAADPGLVDDMERFVDDDSAKKRIREAVSTGPSR
jgi:hypothetical protein